MRFYEQICDGRTLIHSEIIAKQDGRDRVPRDVDASCWIEAKKRLGYSLSAIQEYLLDKFHEDRERAARLYA